MSSRPVPFASRAPRGAEVNWTYGCLRKGEYLVLCWERSTIGKGLYTVHRVTRDNFVNIHYELTRTQLDELIKWYHRNTDIRWEKVRPVIERIAKNGGAK